MGGVNVITRVLIRARSLLEVRVREGAVTTEAEPREGDFQMPCCGRMQASFNWKR